MELKDKNLPGDFADLKKAIREVILENREELKKQGGSDPNEELFRNIADSHEIARRQGYEPGVRLARMARAMALSKGRAEQAIAIISDVYRDPQTAQMVEKAMEAGTPSAGGTLVPEQFSNELIPLLRNYSPFMKAMPRFVPNPSGTIHFPRHTAGSTSYWGREGKKVNASQPSTGRLTLREKTLKGLTAISNKALNVASLAMDQFVIDDLAAGQAVMIDNAAYNGAGNEDEPLGLLKMPTSGANAIGYVSLAARLSTTNSTTILKTHMNNKGTMVRPYWFFNPDIWFELVNITFTSGPYAFRQEMVEKGTFWGIPFGVTQNIATAGTSNNPTDMLLGDMQEYLVAQVRVAEIAYSTEAAYYDDGGNLVSAFANDESVVRLINSLDMGARQLKSWTRAATVQTS